MVIQLWLTLVKSEPYVRTLISSSCDRSYIRASTVDLTDNARDVLNFLLHFLPEKVTPQSLPTHLKQVPDKTSNARRQSGLSQRRLIGIGHSVGGTAL